MEHCNGTPKSLCGFMVNVSALNYRYHQVIRNCIIGPFFFIYTQISYQVWTNQPRLFFHDLFWKYDGSSPRTVNVQPAIVFFGNGWDLFYWIKRSLKLLAILGQNTLYNLKILRWKCVTMTVVPAVALMKNGVSPSSMDSSILFSSVLKIHKLRDHRVHHAISGQVSDIRLLT